MINLLFVFRPLVIRGIIEEFMVFVIAVIKGLRKSNQSCSINVYLDRRVSFHQETASSSSFIFKYKERSGLIFS